MKDRLNQVGRSIGGSSIVRDFLREIGKIYLALLVIGVALGGSYLLVMGEGNWLGWFQPTGIYDNRGSFEWYQEPEVDKPVWEIGAAELNRNRLVYNWTEKSGMKLLGWQMVSLLVGMGLVLHKIRWWEVIEVRRVRSGGVHTADAREGLRGTVRISSLGGVIYISGLPDLSGLEEYGMRVRDFYWLVAD